MRSLVTMKSTYLRKLTALYAGTTLLPAVTKMADDYSTQMTALRDKQLLAKDILNANSIPGGRQAGFQMLVNKFWYLQTVQDYGDPTSVIEFQAAADYFKTKFVWGVAEFPAAVEIAATVFNVAIT